MTALHFCAVCRAASLRSICDACLRERDESTRAVGVASGTGRAAARKSRSGSVAGRSQPGTGESATAARPALLRETVRLALLALSLLPLWVAAVMVENGAQ